MSKVIKFEELQAEIVLPEPLTGTQYAAYVAAHNGGPNTDSWVLKGIRGALALIESGFYIENGTKHNIKEHGLNCSLNVLAWVQTEASSYVTDAIAVPKLSSLPPQEPPTAESRP